jgi:peptidoglycan hydrolase-like protein with peptidoglycan-binding domain
MIRLVNILNEQRIDKLNVLFVTDQPDNVGFAKKLIASNVVTGKIKSYRSNDDSSELNNLVYYNISAEYDLVVIYCSGLKDDSERTVIQNLDNILTTGKRFNIPIVFITIPTTRFIKDTEKLNKKFGFNYIDKINNWIRNKSNVDYVVDLDSLEDDVFFDKDGIELSTQGQRVIYKQLLQVIKSLDNSVDIDTELTKSDSKNGIPTSGTLNSLRKVQDKLVALGYTISDIEIKNNRFGPSTSQAIQDFQMDNRLTTSGKLDSKTIKQLQIQIPIGSTTKIIAPKGERGLPLEIMDFLIDKGLSVAGAAGIVGNMQVESGFNTSVLGDNGTSIGLCQWHNERKDKLFTWTKENNLEPLSVEGQLEYLWMELETSFRSLISKFETISDPQDAAHAFARQFERPSYISPLRLEYAQKYFDAYNSGGISGTLKSIWTGIKTAATIGGAVTGIVGTEIFGSGAGHLIGNKGGGDGGDWGGTLPKLISILPAGNWTAPSQKRGKQLTKSGGVSDHYLGRTDSYACDFGLDSTFGGDAKKATEFAIAIAQNAGKDIDSWTPYIGKYLNINSGGYRVQIIWQSNVGGNHYDHVHVGVRRI